MTHIPRNTGSGNGRMINIPALVKKQRIQNLSKKVRKGKATDKEKRELASLRKKT